MPDENKTTPTNPPHSSLDWDEVADREEAADVAAGSAKVEAPTHEEASHDASAPREADLGLPSTADGGSEPGVPDVEITGLPPAEARPSNRSTAIVNTSTPTETPPSQLAPGLSKPEAVTDSPDVSHRGPALTVDRERAFAAWRAWAEGAVGGSPEDIERMAEAAMVALENGADADRAMEAARAWAAEPAPSQSPAAGPSFERSAPTPPPTGGTPLWSDPRVAGHPDVLAAPPLAPLNQREALPSPAGFNALAPRAQLSGTYAGFWIRTAALTVDTFPFFVAASILAQQGLGNLPALVFVAYAGYFVYMWSAQGQTLGQRLFKLRVRDAATGENPEIGSSIIRIVVFVADSLPFFLGFMWAGWDARKQAWHDKMAGTIVVRAEREET